MMAELLSTLLTLEGYSVTLEKDFEHLEDSLLQNKPDILLMDINLSGCNGLEIIKHFRQTYPDQSISIIAQSGLEQKHLALRSGANGFILKPYEVDDLIKLIKEFEST